jgi:hypothetical protein
VVFPSDDTNKRSKCPFSFASLSLSISLSLTVHALQEAPQKAQHATWWKQNYKYAGAAKVSKEKTMKLGKALPGS